MPGWRGVNHITRPPAAWLAQLGPARPCTVVHDQTVHKRRSAEACECDAYFRPTGPYRATLWHILSLERSLDDSPGPVCSLEVRESARLAAAFTA